MFSSQPVNNFSCFSGSVPSHLHSGERSADISPTVAPLREERTVGDNGLSEKNPILDDAVMID